jgi:hypothetical protein
MGVHSPSVNEQPSKKRHMDKEGPIQERIEHLQYKHTKESK